MKKLLLIITLLTPVFSNAQNYEIGLGSGFAFGDDRYLFHSLKFSMSGKRFQLGVGADMADDPGYYTFATPHVFANAKFPVKHGYFYTGAHLGYAVGWDGLAFGGQTGVSVNVGKHIALNTELLLRLMGEGFEPDPMEPMLGDAEPIAAFTFGLRYRF